MITETKIDDNGVVTEVTVTTPLGGASNQYNPLAELQRLCKQRLYYTENDKEVQSFLISNGGKIYATEAFTQDISDIDQYLFEYLYLDDLTLLDITDKVYTKQP